MLNKSTLASDIETVLNEPIPADLHESNSIKKRNKNTAKGIAAAIDKYLKEGSIDVSSLEWLPGTQVMTNPGQPVANAPPLGGGVGATAGPGTGMTSAPCKMTPPTGIDCGKVY